MSILSPEVGATHTESQGFESSPFNVSFKLYSLLLALQIVIGGVIFYTVNTLDGQKKDGAIINMAGKQRMLTQQLSKDVMDLQLGNLKKSEEIEKVQAQFTKVLDGLQKGDSGLGLPPSESPEINEKLEQVKELWQPFSQHLITLKTSWAEVQNHLDYITSQNVPLFGEAHQVVMALGKVSDPATISFSGRLRALTQRVSKATLQYMLYHQKESAEEAKKFMALQVRILDGLLNGDSKLGLTRVDDKATRNLIEAFKKRWQDFQIHVQFILDNLPRLNESSQYIRDNNIALLKTMNSAVQELAKHSQSKIESMISTEYSIFWSVLFLGLAIGTLLIRGISSPLKQVASTLTELAKGNLDQSKLPVKFRDETGLVSFSCNQLQENLKKYMTLSERVLSGNIPSENEYHLDGDFNTSMRNMITDAAEKKTLDIESGRIRNMMENAPVNVMYANKDLKIQYMNPASNKTLKTLEHLLPVKVKEMIGQSIDIFHKNPQHQRQLLADPKNLPKRANIQVGPETLDLLVSPIYDNKGDYLGPMVTWEVITEKLRNEENLKRIMSRVTEYSTSLAGSAEELTATSQQLAGNAEETAAQAGVVSNASSQVSQSVQSVATGSEQMNSSIREIAQNATEAARVTTSAVKMAETTNNTIQALGNSSNEIGAVIKVITSIAEQTNLLALNATIEAARAGEAGKGFAVVANEVKELANQTSKATEEIGQKIQDIQQNTKNSVDAIGEITSVINRINDISSTIASAVEEQTATTNEMSRSVMEAANGTTEIANNISGVADAAKSTTQGASDSQQAAQELSKMAAELNTLVMELKN